MQAQGCPRLLAAGMAPLRQVADTQRFSPGRAQQAKQAQRACHIPQETLRVLTTLITALLTGHILASMQVIGLSQPL